MKLNVSSFLGLVISLFSDLQKKSPSLSSMWRAFFFKPFSLAHLDLILYGVQLSNGLIIDRLVEFAFCFLGLLIIDDDTGVIDQGKSLGSANVSTAVVHYC